MISIIAAIAQNHALGFENRLLYRLPNDLKRFKALTTGHTIIMGRKTFESFPKGALPNRRNIVLSRNEELNVPGAERFASLQDALAACGTDEQIFIIGGASVYAEALPLADRLLLTHIDDTPTEADVYFPPFETSQWHLVATERHEPDEKHSVPYTFADYEKVR